MKIRHIRQIQLIAEKPAVDSALKKHLVEKFESFPDNKKVQAVAALVLNLLRTKEQGLTSDKIREGLSKWGRLPEMTSPYFKKALSSLIYRGDVSKKGEKFYFNASIVNAPSPDDVTLEQTKSLYEELKEKFNIPYTYKPYRWKHQGENRTEFSMRFDAPAGTYPPMIYVNMDYNQGKFNDKINIGLGYIVKGKEKKKYYTVKKSDGVEKLRAVLSAALSLASKSLKLNPDLSEGW